MNHLDGARTGARARWVGFAILGVLFLLALPIDPPVSHWVYASGFGPHIKVHEKWLLTLFRVFGNFAESTIPIALILLIFGKFEASAIWRAAFVFVSGLLSSSNTLAKWVVGRHRPNMGSGVYAIHPFFGGIHGLGGPNLSFPSGDVCLAAATMSAAAMLFPKYRRLAIGIIILVAAERIGEGAHYPSDTVAGAALGWGGTCLAYRCMRPFRPPSGMAGK